MIELSRITMGCDPEIFFSKNNHIIGSEKILPPMGITVDPNTFSNSTFIEGKTKITRDGIQAELNPTPNVCRANLGNEIAGQFRAIKELLNKFPGVTVDFSNTVKITKHEMASLSAQSKTFGCNPSYNVYHKNATVGVKDPSKYMSRSAGGHIHLGKLNTNAETLVPVLDVILGNTCVMIDKDPGNKIRRKTYGRAGEYRERGDRVEYRTLSNFWLRDYKLFSFVTGLARMAVSLVETSDTYVKKLLSKVKPSKIEAAINNNDYKLATKNFKAIRAYLLKITPPDYGFPIDRNNIKDFEFFVQKGLNFWFKENPLESWCNLTDGHETGWESFLLETVKPLRKNYV